MSDNFLVSEKSLTKVADAIREKNGLEDSLNFPDEFVEQIKNISGIDWLTNLLMGSQVIKSESSYNHSKQVIFKEIAKEDLENIKFAFIISNNYLSGVSLTIPETLASLSPAELIIFINYNGLYGTFIITNDKNGGFTNARLLTVSVDNNNIAFDDTTQLQVSNNKLVTNLGVITYDSSGYVGYFIK